MNKKKRLVGIIMGSDSDWPVMQPAVDICTQFELAYETRIISAHRTPADMSDYARHAHERGLKVIIAGAGGAAHLPGMVASLSPLPVIGVPIAGKTLQGMDALLSIVQMPPGVPVATVAIGGGQNAGILAAKIIANSDPGLQQKVIRFKNEMATQSNEKNKRLGQQKGWLSPDQH